MAFIVYENTIVYKEDDVVLAEIAFPPIGIGTVDICKTHVDESLRGQGMAGQLMERTVNELRKTKRKAVPTCSYAVKWFEEHKDCSDVLKD
jgi:predicted GNAT family acetyltransferase